MGKQKNPIYALDGVRAVACLCVISFHLNLFSLISHIWSPMLNDVGATMISSIALAGEMGIMLFFILSGFLLFLPFAKAILFDQPYPQLRRYYIRRIFRILPGYYVALFLMALYLQPMYLQAAHLHEFWLFLTFRMDFPITYQKMNPPFWTLAIEFQFYLVLPLIAWLIKKGVGEGALRMRVLKMVICILIMLVWGLFTRYWGFLLTSNTPTEDFTLPAMISSTLRPYIFGTSGKYLEVFAIGMLIAVVYLYLQNEPHSGRLNTRVRLLSPCLFVLGLIVIACANLWHYYVVYVHGITLHYLDPYQKALNYSKDVLNPISFALGYGLCLFSILHGPALLKKPFEWLPLRWIGLISYSLYIWHDPFIIFFQLYFLPKFQALGWMIGTQYMIFIFWVLVTVFPLSITFYRWVEMPGVRVGERLCVWLERRRDRDTERIAVTVPEIREAVLD
jgi:peptidoglycan/LPS O-acetylase OafA/YrhL